MGAKDLLKIYISFIRCLLEYACVVWHSTLTVNQTCTLERVQKTCLRAILGREYRGYESALEVSNLEPLEVHREKLCLSFGGKCLLSLNHRSLFPRIFLTTTITLENRIRSQMFKPGRRG